MTSLLSLACARTLTLLATTDAWPATKGTVRNSAAAFFGAGAFFSAFFFGVFFFSDCAVGAFVLFATFVEAAAGTFVAAVAEMAGAGGALVTCCANRLPETKTAKTNQIFFFIMLTY